MTHLHLRSWNPFWWGCLPTSCLQRAGTASRHSSGIPFLWLLNTCPSRHLSPGHTCVSTCPLPALDTKCRAVGGCVFSRAHCAACLSACRHSWRLHGHLQARPGYRVPVLGSDVPTVCLCSSCHWRPEGRNEGGLNAWRPRLCRRGGVAPQATGQGQWPGPPRQEGSQARSRARLRDGRGHALLHTCCVLSWTFSCSF